MLGTAVKLEGNNIKQDREDKPGLLAQPLQHHLHLLPQGGFCCHAHHLAVCSQVNIVHVREWSSGGRFPIKTSREKVQLHNYCHL